MTDRLIDVPSLRPLLSPRSVAVIGASSRPGKIGRAPVEQLRVQVREPRVELRPEDGHGHAVGKGGLVLRTLDEQGGALDLVRDAHVVVVHVREGDEIERAQRD